VCERLLAQGNTVIGIDSLNEYYDPALKRHRILRLNENKNFSFVFANLAEYENLGCPDTIIHVAAQPGVGRSITDPDEYFNNNVLAFWKVLEACAHSHRLKPVKLLYASSSSVYGDNDQAFCREFMTTSKPLSFYAATKKSNEVMAHSYSHVYGFPSIGMRFFTVYGPWGRPDMAYWKFADAITSGDTIKLHNGGTVTRDFTYIDDVVDAIMLLMDAPAPDHSSTVYNIGSQNPQEVLTLLSLIEKELCKRASSILSVPLPVGMAKRTCADNWKLHTATGYVAKTSLAEGVKKFVDWYKEYHGKK
jgi:UDP-glucuronate 4-epimerase